MRFEDPCKKEEYVHAMFSSIAHRYDLLNTVLSFNQDKYWRRFAVRHSGLKPGGKGLDVACGTGMLSFEQARTVGPTGSVTGVDFCAEMLKKAEENLKKSPYQGIVRFIQGNALDLPFAENTFDCATIGFALRNVPDVRKTIKEMARVVKPGGKVVNLELGKPGALGFKQAYWLYFDKLVPIMGRMGAGLKGPYSYLPNSLKYFMHQTEIRELFTELGLADARNYDLTGGIVAVQVGTKVG
ncbi:MAG: bifunctional demethylmenaquinone methyltransferase/2-methoxy-6-polyprenyl-1,4-benzoquinol methylase UbiE [Desulforudis sp.]|jgi:demethylmenaquinone methyltransferase/2-methoxy-6-polyprenyl-1,4-benzoquinol methylase|nr:bifunctional demethylmenaquinone methyltransferase/2-methoxy-6-polyprenyl-1,4-benzoquinol methylase UbiE [Clostridia bacterium]MDQ7790615.1 bifunctional demethylmenaquinone methyltransferase/2-methoxy-6-polyprenyl-1,4-benzoquinol methylase UbiE [Clostridia bacterium]RJX21077.1 MAG: bifunctional demethylmenaquinone methyltransferase/2-methoxy-6-polyprenyl-1,4-benzoquinol methylase UbiE [Desulforudis sp.]